MDKEDEASEYRKGWIDHPVTRALRKATEAELAQVESLLESASFASTDPKVRYYVGVKLRLKGQLETFQTAEPRTSRTA